MTFPSERSSKSRLLFPQQSDESLVCSADWIWVSPNKTGYRVPQLIFIIVEKLEQVGRLDQLACDGAALCCRKKSKHFIQSGPPGLREFRQML